MTRLQPADSAPSDADTPSSLRVLSLGAGVQSTTLALMSAAGELEPLDCAIFADTQAEPAAVYRHLEWLTQPGLLPFPVYTVTVGNLAEILIHPPAKGWKSRTMMLPAHQPPNGMARKYCTSNYKTHPIRKKLNALRRKADVELWIGISTDEAMRMKPAQEPWLMRRHPLIERHMSRMDCRGWIFKHGYPQPPKSSCVFCPYRGDSWGAMKRDAPDDWKLACKVDDAIRENFAPTFFVHRSLQRLADADVGEDQPELFGNECEGMCGV